MVSKSTEHRAERTPAAVAVSLYRAGAWSGIPSGRILDQASSILGPVINPGQSPALVAEQTESPGLPGSTSLVGTGHNSSTCLTTPVCPDAGWLLGRCEHGTERWIKLRCKRRTCPVCGEERKHRVSWRIQLGIESLSGDQGAGWFVGTFAEDIEKTQAVRTVAKFIKWLRKSQPQLQYASTWELTMEGRLHVNLVMAPWSYVRQKDLSRAWQRYSGGPVVWVERVGAAGRVGNEVAKVGRRKIGNYVAKWDQMVKDGRGVTFSQGWPALPESLGQSHRYGEIAWRFVGRFEAQDIMFDYERQIGVWNEVAPGEFASAYGEECHCFDYVDPKRRPDRCDVDVGLCAEDGGPPGDP